MILVCSLALLSLFVPFCVYNATAATKVGAGYWINQGSIPGLTLGYHRSELGTNRSYDGKPRYCIEVQQPGKTGGTWHQASSPDDLTAATMVDRHANDMSDFTQAAVSYALHIHLDKSITAQQYERFLTTYGVENGDIWAIRSKAQQFWNEARAATATNVRAEYAYSNVHDSGYVTIGIMNPDGAYALGIPYSITASGPVSLDTTSGVTSGALIRIPWHATGVGNVSVSVRYQTRQALVDNDQQWQDHFTIGEEKWNVAPAMSFRVVKRYQPRVASSVPDTRVERGSAPLDDISVTMDEGGEWPSNAVRVSGDLYGPFVSQTEADNPANWTQSRLMATAYHDFSEPGDYSLTARDVQATKASGHEGTVDALPTGWYRWVWSILRDRQAGDARDGLVSDVTDASGVLETGQVLHAMQVRLSSRSSGETAQPGELLSDDVTLGVDDVNRDGVEDTQDWLHTAAAVGPSYENENNQIPVTIVGGLYMVPGDLPQESVTLPDGAVKVAAARVVMNRAGTVHADGQLTEEERASGVMQDSLTPEPGYCLENLPAGAYWWQWSARNADQQMAADATGHALADDFPFEHDVDMLHAEDVESTVVMRMQPLIMTTVDASYAARGEEDGEPSDVREAAYPNLSGEFGLAANAVEHVEKGRGMTDAVTIELDPAVAHNTWYVDAEGEPVTVRAEGTLYGPLDRGAALKYVADGGGDPGVSAEGLPVAAAAILDVTRPGTYVVDGVCQGEKRDELTFLGEGDGANPASGWYLWQWTISNDSQTELAEQTGVTLLTEGDDEQPAYPFVHDVSDDLGAAGENIVVPITPTLTSLVGNVSGSWGVDAATGLPGVVRGSDVKDTVTVAPTNPQDLWLTWTEGKDPSDDDIAEMPVSVTLVGTLYRIDDERWKELSDHALPSVPAWAGDPVAERRIEGVDHFGSYDAPPVRADTVGIYVWYWEVVPGHESAQDDADAWFEWTRGHVSHDFGLESESFVVSESIEESGCVVATSASGDVAPHGMVHDTATITCKAGADAQRIPDGIDFPLYRRAAKADANADVLVATTARKTIDVSAFPIVDGKVEKDTTVTVVSDEIAVPREGEYYFAERAFRGDAQLSAGEKRCERESVSVVVPPQTGVTPRWVVAASTAAIGVVAVRVSRVHRRR